MVAIEFNYIFCIESNSIIGNTVEPLLKDWPIGHKQYLKGGVPRSLVTGSIALKCGTFCQEYVVLQGSGLSRQVSLYSHG